MVFIVHEKKYPRFHVYKPEASGLYFTNKLKYFPTNEPVDYWLTCQRL